MEAHGIEELLFYDCNCSLVHSMGCAKKSRKRRDANCVAALVKSM